jgi:hypothetical protein
LGFLQQFPKVGQGALRRLPAKSNAFLSPVELE